MNNARALRFFISSAVYRRMMHFRFSQGQAVKLFKSIAMHRPNPGYFLAAIIPSVFVVKAMTEKNIVDIIKEADVLYGKNLFNALYDILLPHKGAKEPELLWRLARALFERSREMNKDEKLRTLEEALSLVDEALAIDDSCWAAHKWRAILLDYVWRHKSRKGRIVHSFDVKKHMERAIELNPKDSTSYYLLGEWCFTFADMPWCQRKVAGAIFASPPTSTYEEALKYFEKAEENSPLFYSMNLLMLGKCMLRLNNPEKAIAYLRQAKDYPVKTADDRQAHSEAVKLLNKLKAE